MNTRLPAELRQALRQNPDTHGLRLEDEQTHAVYFVVDEETHRRAMRALQEQEDLASIARGVEQMEAGEGRSLAEADAAMRKELGFSPRQ